MTTINIPTTSAKLVFRPIHKRIMLATAAVAVLAGLAFAFIGTYNAAFTAGQVALEQQQSAMTQRILEHANH